MSMYARLTTAEGLVLEVLVAHKRLEAPYSRLDSRLWVKPQPETLREHGLMDSTFDGDANFRVTSPAQLISSPEATATADRFCRADCPPSTLGAFAGTRSTECQRVTPQSNTPAQRRFQSSPLSWRRCRCPSLKQGRPMVSAATGATLTARLAVRILKEGPSDGSIQVASPTRSK